MSSGFATLCHFQIIHLRNIFVKAIFGSAAAFFRVNSAFFCPFLFIIL